MTAVNACVYAAALSGLPGIGPARLVALLDRFQPGEAWAAVLAGAIGGSASPGPSSGGPTPGAAQAAAWQAAARRTDLGRIADHLQQASIGVTWRGRPDFPAALRDDPHPPGVLFWRGELSWLARPCVAIVGTRSCTPDGAQVAFDLGRELARAGICVVSGLALGIDGAAHAGVLQGLVEGPALRPALPGSAAGPVGVAASGVDVAYPRAHRQLWERVARDGGILSETPPGRPAQAWRFPARNRIIAGLVRLVVVVESHRRGGSLITAEAAMERGIDVRVVPGSVRSPASEGSNRLLVDGPAPVTGSADVLDALGFVLPAAGTDDATGPGPGSVPAPGTGRAAPDPSAATDRRIVESVGVRPVPLGVVVDRSGLPVAVCAAALHRLELTGVVRRCGDWWVVADRSGGSGRS